MTLKQVPTLNSFNMPPKQGAAKGRYYRPLAAPCLGGMLNNLVGDVKAKPRDFYRYINSQKKTPKVFHP